MIRPAILLVLIPLLLFSLSGRTQMRAAHRVDPSIIPDEVLVTVEPAAWQELLSNLPLTGDQLGGEVLSVLPELHTFHLKLTEGESVSDAVKRLERLPSVTAAEPNLRLRGAALNDTYYDVQRDYLESIQAPAAWELTQGDSSVIVAVLDSGVDLTHPDLQGVIWTNPFEQPNGEDDDLNGCVDDLRGCSFLTSTTSDPSCAQPASSLVLDDYGHGTFVTGIIAANANNGAGVTGVAPGVTIMPVKILDCLGNGSAAAAAEGLLYAARNGARVANVSFSASGPSWTLTNAVREAHDRYGMIIVAASGNDGWRGVTFPASLPETIAVGSSGAVEGADLRSPFSDWGPEVDVVAPGMNIVSTVPAALCGDRWHCFVDQPYAVSSGTSFAAPMVSSLAALIVSQYPNLNPETVRMMILRTAQPLPEGDTPDWAGAGRIRLRAALEQQRYQIGAAGVSTAP